MKTECTLRLSPLAPIISLLAIIGCLVAPNSPAQTNCAPAPSGLVGWWRGQGNTLDSGGTNNGTLVGHGTYGAGQVGQGFLLDGDGDAVTLGNPASLQLQNFTIEAWIRRSSVFLVSFSGNGIGQLFAYGQNGYGLYLDPFGTPALTKVGFNDVKPAVSITDTNLHHLAVTKSGGTVVFYVDGVAYPAAAYGSTFTFTTSVAVGARGDNWDNSFYGLIDELSIYNRALATNEVQGIYQAGAWGKCVVAPEITAQPQSVTVLVGTNVTFNITATGTMPLSYQWRFNETNIAGATGTALTLTNVQLASAGNYSAVVTNEVGIAISSNAVLTVNTSPPCATPPSGMVSWWKAETNALDSVGTNHGTLVGSTAYGVGRVGQAFVLDGSGDLVTVGNPTDLQLQNFTIETWIKRSSLSEVSFGSYGIGIIFGYGSGGYGLYLDPNGTPALSQVGNGETKPATAITDTNFHHLAVTKSGGAVVFYVDGTAYAAPDYDPGFSFSTVVAIGARGDNSDNSFFGRIDEVSVYNRALSTNEIHAIYNAGSLGKCSIAPTIISQPTNQSVVVGEIAIFRVIATGTAPLNYQWRFNGTNLAGATGAIFTLNNVQLTNVGNYSVVVSNEVGSVTSSNALLAVNPPPPCVVPLTGLVSWWRGESNALDSVSINNGVLTNQATYTGGRVGKAFTFDGSGDGVLLGNPANLRLQDLTIELWIKRADASIISQVGGNGELVAYGGGGYGFGMLDNGNLFLTKVDVDNVTLGTGVTDTNWHHLAVTKSGSTVVFYIDGNPYPVPAYNPVFTFATSVAIGVRGDNSGNSFLGSIDEVGIYNRALASNEIQAIYNAGAAGKCLLVPTIVSQPTNQTVVVGDVATFSVTAAGTPPFSYQWRFNQTNLVGATGATLILTGVHFTNAGNYSVVVSNEVWSVTSSNALLTVNPAPPCVAPVAGLISWWRGETNTADSVGTNNGTLTNQATYISGKVGAGFVFDGDGDAVRLGNPPSLQLQNFTIETWVKRASATRATGDAGHIQGAILHYGNGGYGFAMYDDGRMYLTKVGISSVTSTLSVTDTNFHHIAVSKSGSTVIFYVDGVAEVAGSYNPGFTFGSTVAIGAEGNGLSVGFLGTIDELSFYNRALTSGEIQAIYGASVSGKCVVPVGPVILTHPQNVNALVGTNVTFSVLAGGSVPLSYQWRANGTNIPGATGATLVLTNVHLSHAGSYTVQVTNTAGSATSSNATLTVIFPTAVVRVGATNDMGGRLVSVPVTLAANGNENGLGFSLNFNPQRLAFASAKLGSGAAGATLFVNTSLTATGRLGVAVAYPPQQNFTPGTQEVVRVSFNTLPVLGGASVNATNSFTDQPVLRELYDAQLQTLPANYSNGIVTLTPTVFEADVFPRPSGNQAVSGTDWVQAGRFAARLDAATVGSELQRADVAPRSTQGDGQMKVTDWVQAGRYLGGFDVLSAVGGPTNETLVGSGSMPVARQVRVTNTNAVQQQTAKISVLLEAQGDENAVGFTLSYNPAGLAYGNVSLGSGSPGANLVVNTNQAGAGRLGVVLALPAGSSFSAGTRELVQINLTPTTDVAGPVGVSLSDQLVTRCAADAQANELPVNYVDGTVMVTPINPNPILEIAAVGPDVVLTWPMWAADYTLQTLAGSNGVAGSWSNTPTSLQTNGATVFVTLPLGPQAKYFRLYHP